MNPAGKRISDKFGVPMPKRILVIDPIPTHRIRLKAALRAAQYDIASVDRIACVSGVVATLPVDMIVLNTSGTEPSRMMAKLHQAIEPLDIPVLCRDENAGPARRMQALATGARDMVSTRIPEPLLLARLRGLFRERESQEELEHRRVAAASFGFREATASFAVRSKVACVSVGADQGMSPTGCGLALLPHEVIQLPHAELLRADGYKPDVIVLWVCASGVDLLDDFLPELRVRSHLRQASVLVVHPEGDFTIAVRAMNLGASEIADDQSSEGELAHRIEAMLERQRVRDALRRSTEESFRLATTDALTGLFNRRYAEVYLADVILRARENKRGFTVMMIDVDHFKSVNDTYGHAAGDMVLCEVARRLRDNLRAVDLVSRHGGEEFLVVLPEIEEGEAGPAAERLLRTVGHQPVILPDGRALDITVSIGVSVVMPGEMPVTRSHSDGRTQPPQDMIECLLSRVDDALYAAKNAGRNRVFFSLHAASAA